jgi:hypothetical protein
VSAPLFSLSPFFLFSSSVIVIVIAVVLLRSTVISDLASSVRVVPTPTAVFTSRRHRG